MTDGTAPLLRLTELVGEPPAPFSGASVTAAIANRVSALDDTPYTSEFERYLCTVDDDPGEIFHLGRPLRGSRCFPSKARKRRIEMLESFEKFSKDKDFSNWYSWNIGLPNRKADPNNLKNELKRFNTRMNIESSLLRKSKSIEIFLIIIHIRYDWSSRLIDLHAHVICRVEQENIDHVQGKLGNAFSKVYVEEIPVNNPAICANYALSGIIKIEEFINWPDDAFKATWDLTLSKAHLVRTGGSFAEFRKVEEAGNRGKSPGGGILQFGPGVIQQTVWCCRIPMAWMPFR